MNTTDRLDRIETILSSLVDNFSRHDEILFRHEEALTRIDARLDRASELIESNARAILAQRDDFNDAIEVEREETMTTEEIFKGRLDGLERDLSSIRQSIESINDSVISITTFFREEFGRIWERLRSS